MKWISVEASKPNDGANVIAVVDSVFVVPAQYRSGIFFDIVKDKNGCFFETVSRDVSHWMPFPKPPCNTKYDWSNVLNHVKWIATDKDGYAWMYESKPSINYGSEKWEGSEEVIHFHPESTFTGDWKESLEQRPGEEDERTN